MLAFSSCKFSLRFSDVILATYCAGNIIHEISNFFFAHFVFRLWKYPANCIVGFKSHFDTMIAQNSLYGFGGPAHVWYCAIFLFRLCTSCILLFNVIFFPCSSCLKFFYPFKSSDGSEFNHKFAINVMFMAEKKSEERKASAWTNFNLYWSLRETLLSEAN